MKNIQKVLGMMGLVLALGVVAYAANYVIPQSLNGNAPGDANLLGVDVIDSTGTRTYGLTAPCYLHWVLVSSDTASNYASIRDTDTLNTSSDIKLTVTTAANVSGAPALITFNPPVIFRNGMSINLALATTGRWMFGYRRRLDAKIGADPTQGTSASD